MPDIPFNLMPLIVATVVGFLFTFMWYSALFGRAWAIEMGFDPDEEPQTISLLKSLAMTVLAIFLISFVLSNNIAAWTPSTWGIQGADMPAYLQAVQAAFFTWVGYFVSVLLVGVAWEKRSWKLFAIDASFYLGLLFIVALILLYLG